MTEWLICQPAEMEYLGKRDKRLGKVIESLGQIKRGRISDPFQGLVNALIGQQISSKAHRSIWQRFMQSFNPVTPENIINISAQQMRDIGISQRKASYIQGIAQEFMSGRMDDLRQLSDASLSERLLNLKGVGPWTVEMLLIFTFDRKNILSAGDLAIQRGLCLLYGHKEITPQLFERYYKRYSPFATAASLYLWEVAAGAYKARNGGNAAD